MSYRSVKKDKEGLGSSDMACYMRSYSPGWVTLRALPRLTCPCMLKYELHDAELLNLVTRGQAPPDIATGVFWLHPHPLLGEEGGDQKSQISDGGFYP